MKTNFSSVLDEFITDLLGQDSAEIWILKQYEFCGGEVGLEEGNQNQ
jgi:hypothetical protein